MKRAQLYLWSLLHSVDQIDDRVLSELAGQVAGELPIADKEQKRLDMEVAVGAWAERDDLPDSLTYISNLRNEVREHKLTPA
jgi:hypothetical protein